MRALGDLIHSTATPQWILGVSAPLIGTSTAMVLSSGYQPTLDKRLHHNGGWNPSLNSLSADRSAGQVNCSSAPRPCGPRRRRSFGCLQYRLHLQINEEMDKNICCWLSINHLIYSILHILGGFLCCFLLLVLWL